MFCWSNHQIPMILVDLEGEVSKSEAFKQENRSLEVGWDVLHWTDDSCQKKNIPFFQREKIRTKNEPVLVMFHLFNIPLLLVVLMF